LDRVPAPLNSSDFFAGIPDARQVAIEFAKSHRVWLSILTMTWVSMAAAGKKRQPISNPFPVPAFQPRMDTDEHGFIQPRTTPNTQTLFKRRDAETQSFDTKFREAKLKPHRGDR
jgi:hypothetical protein